MSQIQVDTITESTSNTGVTVESVLLKDGVVKNSDGGEVGALVLLASEEMSSTSAVEFYTATTGWTKTKYNAF